MTQPLELFYSYSHKDEELRNQLETHLSMLKREGVISGWHDRRISAGQDWDGEIDEHLDSADIILLLVSSDFLASDYCYEKEVKRAVERHEAGQARVIPIIVRSCDWQRAPFAKLQALPKDAKAVTTWHDRDEAFLDVARGLRTAAAQISAQSVIEPPSPSLLIDSLPNPDIPDVLRVSFVRRRDREGKDIVARLQEDLSPGKNSLVALWGFGGVGKTAIAAETARGLVEPFAKRVVWVSADGLESFSLSTLLDTIATKLAHPDLRKLAPDLKIEQVRELVRSAPTLIVLDNFETIHASERETCVEWLGKPAPCAVLMTTRDRIDDARNIPVEAMLREEAERLLDELISEVHDPRAFANLDRDRLIKTAEANPLVLQWIVGQIDLAQDPDEVLDDLQHGEGSAADRVFNRSYELEQLNNGGRAVLLALSLFAPSATRKAVAEVSGMGKERDKKKFKAAVKSLAALWLIRTADENHRLAVEGLTRELTKGRLDADPRAKPFRQRFASRFLHLSKTNSEITSEHFAALQAEKENLVNAIDVAFEIGDWATVTRITRRIWSFLDLRGYWEDATRLGEQALTAAEQSDQLYEIGAFADSLADTLINRSQYLQAMTYLKRARVIAEGLHAQQGLAATLGKIAEIELHTGNPQEARRLYTEALNINLKLNDQNGASSSLYFLAAIAALQGDTDEARRLQEESFHIVKTLHDENALAASYVLLGSFEDAQGNIEEAERLYEKAMTIAERLGDERSKVAIKEGLADIALNQGDFEKADRLYLEAGEIYTTLGREIGVASSLRGRGRLNREQGHFVPARDLYRESLEIERRIGHLSGQANSLFLLGELSLDESLYENALTFLLQSLNIFRKLQEIWGLAETLRVLGDLRAAEGSVSEAGRYYDEGLAYAKSAGFKRPTAKLFYSMGILAGQEKNTRRSRELIVDSLKLFETLRSPKADAARAALERLDKSES